MNKVISIGNVVRDPEVRYSGELCIARWSMALKNNKKNDDGTYGADFPSYVAFGQTAQVIEKYVSKGSKLAVEGRITTGSYTDKDGKKVYTTEVTADRVELLDKKGEGSSQPVADADQGFMNIPDGLDEELPFN